MRALVRSYSLWFTPLILGACVATPAQPPARDISADMQSMGVYERAAIQADTEQNIDALLTQLTLDEKISLVHANGKFSVAAVERLGIHETWLSDGPHGVREEISRHKWDPAGWEDDQSTYLPPLTTVAASWNPEMAALHGDVLGSEARHRNKDFILGPGVNLARLPLYGRNFEYLGEDPYLAGELAVAEIQAIQKNDVAATIKHYALNTQELNRSYVDNNPDERTLREIYLPAFEVAVKEANVLGVMGGYNAYKGENVNQSAELMQEILKDEWGFKGVVMTDWNVDIQTYPAAMNGLDLEMGTVVEGAEDGDYSQYFFAQPLKDMIEQGKVPESVLDEKVRRLLRVHFLIGKMDKYRQAGQRNIPEHQQKALRIAEEGVTLLKNSPIKGKPVLPLDKSTVKNILVLGPNADRVHASGGGSTTIKALYEITPLQGLKNVLGDDVNITTLRVRSEADIHPIADEYVKTRHWTGIPSWNIAYFESAAHKNQIGFDHIAYSQLTVENDKTVKRNSEGYTHALVFADIVPLASGTHTFKIKSQDHIQLQINDKTITGFKNRNDVVKVPVELNAGEYYRINIRFNGTSGFAMGWDTPESLFSTEQEALAAAKKADTVLYIGGHSHADDREGYDRQTMVLPNQQDAIIHKLVKQNPETVVVMMSGSAVEMPWLDDTSALVWTGFGGAEGGNALAKVLFGDVNPSGKMPYTLPKKLVDTPAIALDDYNPDNVTYPEGVFMGYRWFDQQSLEPHFPFGFGLSYTNFEYSDLTLSKSDWDLQGTLTASFTITNTGKVAGAEIAQLYVSDKEASVPRPEKELKGFDKVYLQPGQSRKITLSLQPRDLAFWDVKDSQWLVENGQFEIHIGRSSTQLELTQGLRVER